VITSPIKFFYEGKSTCAHELHVIVARKLPGMDVGSILRKHSLEFLSKIVVPAK
jgi:hypothetical protein